MVLAATTVAVFADSKIEFKVTEGSGTSATAILIGQGKIRFDGDATTSAIIDPKEGSITAVDHAAKTWTKITKADLQQSIQQLQQAMAQVPPEMQQQVQQMMAGRMGGGAAQASVVTDTGEKATVMGKSCRIFRTTQGGRTTMESCLAEASAIDIPAADKETMMAAMAFSKELTDAFAKLPMMGQVASKTTPFAGGLVPLRTTQIAADGTRQTSEFSNVSTAAVPAAMFAAPAGYKEQKLPTMGRGRGGN